MVNTLTLEQMKKESTDRLLKYKQDLYDSMGRDIVRCAKMFDWETQKPRMYRERKSYDDVIVVLKERRRDDEKVKIW